MMPPNYVDLTLEPEEEDVVVVASNSLNIRDRTVPWAFAPPIRGQNPFAPSSQAIPPRRAASPAIKKSPGSRPAARLGSVGVQGTPQATTPSKSARFSVLEDAEPLMSDLQPQIQPSSALGVAPPPLPNPNPRNSTPQPPARAQKEQHTPRMQTPNGLEWTVDQIADKLGALVGQVRHDHSRLVEFMLEEAERKAPEQKHISAFDDFADMKSIALEPGTVPDPELETMVVKFKASLCRAYFLDAPANSPSSSTAESTESTRETGNELRILSFASSATRNRFLAIDSTTSRSEKTSSPPIRC